MRKRGSSLCVTSILLMYVEADIQIYGRMTCSSYNSLRANGPGALGESLNIVNLHILPTLLVEICRVFL